VKREHAIMLRAVRDELDERMAKLAPGAQSVQLAIPAPRVQAPAVDMRPVASAIESMTRVVADSLAERREPVDLSPIAEAMRYMGECMEKGYREMAEAMSRRDDILERLVKALEDRPPTEFKPVVNVPEIKVPETKLTIKHEYPARPKRRVTIQHDDGTKSTLTED